MPHATSRHRAADIAASWQAIISPPEGVTSARQAFYVMVDTVEAPDPSTVVFHLKFATTAFLPALADPFAFIYEKAILDRDPHLYEKNVMGSGPFKFVSYEAGQSIKGERNPDYYRKGLPLLDGFVGVFAPKLATRVDAIRADRAQMEFRSEPPSARDQLVKELGDQIAVPLCKRWTSPPDIPVPRRLVWWKAQGAQCQSMRYVDALGATPPDQRPRTDSIRKPRC